MKDAEYTIRLASAKDIEQIAKLYIKSWQKTYKGLLNQEYLDGLTVKKLSKRWGDYILEERHGIFVAVCGEQLLGFGAFKPYHRIDDCIYIESLHVDESCHGKGIGSSIIDRIRAVGIAENYGKMAVCLVKGNDNARNVYVKLGASHYRDKVDDFTGEITYSEIMTWELPKKG